MNFMKKIFISDVEKAKKSDVPTERLVNVSWPSEATATLDMVTVGQCKRALFYKIIGETPSEPFSPYIRAICDSGNMYEEYHINKHKEMGIHVKEQTKIEYMIPNSNNKVFISGKGDEIINHNGRNILLEMKSISAYKAPDIMGFQNKLPIPADKNLMQAMLYKYYYSKDTKGIKENIKDVYLFYINRSDGSICYFEIDLNENGYPIITAYDITGKLIYKKDMELEKTYKDIYNSNTKKADSNISRFAGLRININDIFSGYDKTYTYVRNQVLPDKDFDIVYNKEQLDLKYKLGLISTSKYNDAIKGKNVCGDIQCKYCPYQKKCLKDGGTVLQ